MGSVEAGVWKGPISPSAKTVEGAVSLSSSATPLSSQSQGQLPGDFVDVDCGLVKGGDTHPHTIISEKSSLRSFVSLPTASAREPLCSGAKHFPAIFDERPVGRKRKKVRTRRLEPEPPSSPPGQKWSKQVRRRRQKWKRLREVLQLRQFIPEATLIDLAEMEGVKDNEAGLEGWTVDQLLQKVSEGATGGFELLACAVEDIIEKLDSKGQRLLKIRSSNITQWRQENQKWLQAQADDVILLQDTHLKRAPLASAVAAMRKAGYEMVGGEAASSTKGGTLGGWQSPSAHSPALLHRRLWLQCSGTQSQRSEPPPP